MLPDSPTVIYLSGFYGTSRCHTSIYFPILKSFSIWNSKKNLYCESTLNVISKKLFSFLLLPNNELKYWVGNWVECKRQRYSWTEQRRESATHYFQSTRALVIFDVFFLNIFKEKWIKLKRREENKISHARAYVNKFFFCRFLVRG